MIAGVKVFKWAKSGDSHGKYSGTLWQKRKYPGQYCQTTMLLGKLKLADTN